MVKKQVRYKSKNREISKIWKKKIYKKKLRLVILTYVIKGWQDDSSESIKDIDIKYITPEEIKILWKYQVFEGM